MILVYFKLQVRWPPAIRIIRGIKLIVNNKKEVSNA